MHVTKRIEGWKGRELNENTLTRANTKSYYIKNKHPQQFRLYSPTDGQLLISDY